MQNLKFDWLIWIIFNYFLGFSLGACAFVQGFTVALYQIDFDWGTFKKNPIISKNQKNLNYT